MSTSITDRCGDTDKHPILLCCRRWVLLGTRSARCKMCAQPQEVWDENTWQKHFSALFLTLIPIEVTEHK